MVVDFQEIASPFFYWDRNHLASQGEIPLVPNRKREKKKKFFLEDANEPQKKKKEVFFFFFNETLLLKAAQFATNFWRNVKVTPLGPVYQN